jgi:oligopeptide/dipeptide ABC transporter ATP-binding protein
VPGPILDVSDLSIAFRAGKTRHRAVDHVSFSVSEGEILSLVGESGCGKSVTALSLLRLLPEPPARIEGGRALFRGADLLALPERELRAIRGREIGFVFQEPATSLNPVFPVGAQIAEAVSIHGRVSARKAREAAIAAMADVGIPAPEERYGHYPHQLSGGMRQRIMIAMALVGRPSLLIADEPTTALDVTIQAQILELIGKLRENHRMAVILITHDLGVVAETADRVAVMYAGSIVEYAPVGALFARPLHPYTRALARSLPKPGGRTGSERLATIPGRVPALGGVPPHCRFFDRCPDASSECKSCEPELREVAPERFLRCVRG